MHEGLDIQVRSLTLEDIPLIADYWQNSDEAYLRGMGADINKLPDRNTFTQMLKKQLALPDNEKSSLALIIQVDGVPKGHCNVNKISFGREAFMHLHIWNPASRMKGLGLEMVKLSIPQFFRRLELQTLWCEPYAGNPGPNKTLTKAGFKFIKKYRTTPGPINFEQDVNQYCFRRENPK